jgi:hypothetical protein
MSIPFLLMALAVGAGPPASVVLRAKPGNLPAAVRAAAAMNCTVRTWGALPDTVLLSCAGDAESQAKLLAALPGVRFAEPEIFRRVKLAGEGDPRRAEQWWLDTVRADDAWAVTTGDPNVIVAVLDNGTAMDHPDLAGQFVGGIDVIDGDDNPEPGCTFYFDGRGEVSSCPAETPYLESHGTAVCGIVAAVRDNGVGVSGLCPTCSLLAVRLLDGNDVLSSFRFSEAVALAIQAGASVLNNSWGIDEWEYRSLTAVEKDTFAYAASARDGKGAVIVFSAGNDGANLTREPYASQPSVIAVGASSRIDDWVPYSNIGAVLDIVAPSKDATDAPEDDGAITTTDLVGPVGYSIGDYTSFSGTSASAPIVSAAAGLLLSHRPELTAQQVRLALVGSAVQITATHMPWVELLGRDVATEFAYDADGHSIGFGYGRLDAAAALAYSDTLSPLGGPCVAACAACDGDVCRTACSDDNPCPRGATCDATGLCTLPQPNVLGGPCDDNCEACVPALETNDVPTTICSIACDADAPCPDGYACRRTEAADDAPSICVPGELNEAFFGDAVSCLETARSAVTTTLVNGVSICTDSCAAAGEGACPPGFACTQTSCRCALYHSGWCFVQECGDEVAAQTTESVCMPLPETGVDCAGGCFPGDVCTQAGDCRPDDRAGCDICALCARTETCAPGESCVFTDDPLVGNCSRPCAGDSDCPGDARCKTFTVSGITRHLCGSADDAPLCAPEATCTSSGCSDASSCATGESCVAGVCEAPEPEPEPETDVDVPDETEIPASPDCGGCASTSGPSSAGLVWAFALALCTAKGRRRAGRAVLFF